MHYMYVRIITSIFGSPPAIGGQFDLKFASGFIVKFNFFLKKKKGQRKAKFVNSSSRPIL